MTGPRRVRGLRLIMSLLLVTRRRSHRSWPCGRSHVEPFRVVAIGLSVRRTEVFLAWRAGSRPLTLFADWIDEWSSFGSWRDWDLAWLWSPLQPFQLLLQLCKLCGYVGVGIVRAAPEVSDFRGCIVGNQLEGRGTILAGGV